MISKDMNLLLTREQVVSMVQQVRIDAYDNDDPEAASSSERRLYQSIVLAAAQGQDVKELAELALQTQKWNFRRW